MTWFLRDWRKNWSRSWEDIQLVYLATIYARPSRDTIWSVSTKYRIRDLLTDSNKSMCSIGTGCCQTATRFSAVDS
jgi:hypothetical protein